MRPTTSTTTRTYRTASCFGLAVLASACGGAGAAPERQVVDCPDEVLAASFGDCGLLCDSQPAAPLVLFSATIGELDEKLDAHHCNYTRAFLDGLRNHPEQLVRTNASWLIDRGHVAREDSGETGEYSLLQRLSGEGAESSATGRE